jgi:hypothetical protein
VRILRSANISAKENEFKVLFADMQPKIYSQESYIETRHAVFEALEKEVDVL